jgi:hypothetical protein
MFFPVEFSQNAEGREVFDLQRAPERKVVAGRFHRCSLFSASNAL